MEYGIKIYYHTGDSFNNYDESTEVEWQWNNVDVVKENIDRIWEHGRIVEDNGYNHNAKDRKNLLRNSRFSIPKAKRDDDYEYEHSIMLLKDDGTSFQTSTSSWVGYFESVMSVEMVTVKKHEYKRD